MVDQPNFVLCASCGHEVRGSYCSVCGEAVVDEEALTLRGFLLGSVRTFTDLEHGLWPSVRQLVAKPGMLTKDYLEGRRVGRVPPLRLFLVINVLYFLTQPFLMSNTYNTTLIGHVNRQIYSGLVKEMIDKTVAGQGGDFDAYAEKFDSMSSTLVRTLIVVLVPLFAMATGLFFRRRGVPAVGHLVFALHFISYYLLFGSIALGLVVHLTVWLIRVLGGHTGSLLNEMTLTTTMVVLAVGYLLPAFRRVFELGKWQATGMAVLMALLFFPMIFFYRFGLFWMTWLLV